MSGTLCTGSITSEAHSALVPLHPKLTVGIPMNSEYSKSASGVREPVHRVSVNEEEDKQNCG